MVTKIYLIFFCTLFCTSISFAQVKISENTNPSSPDADAILELESTTLGLIISRLTTANRPTADASNKGMIIYNMDSNQLQYCNGSAWIDLIGADNMGNHVASSNITLNGNHISNDGTNNGIFIDNNNQVGINTANPTAKLDVNGTIIAGATNTVISPSTLTGSEAIVIPGTDSDYIISTQDGNGRIQHKWNASHGTGETYLVGGEDAAFIDINATASDNNTAWIEFKHADGSNAASGDPISWNTQMIINQGGEIGINETSPDDMLHVTAAGNGTRLRAENSGNGWAGFLSKNTIGEIFMGIQGAFDANPGEFHIFDNVAGARRMVIDAAGEVGIGKNNPSVKLDVNGSVNCTGGTCSSDIRWKKDVQTLPNSLQNIQKLRGVSYYWKTSEFPDRDFSTDKQIGLIAQEVEAVYPELVKTDNEGFKSMDYMSLTAILLEAVKEQQNEIDALKKLNAQHDDLENRLEKLEVLLQSASTAKN